MTTDSLAPATAAPQPGAGTVAAQLSGTISDSQVAVGNGNMQVSTGGGDCIINQAVHRPPRPREALCVLPRPQPGLVGRDDEVALALATVADREPVQFHGRRGSGKTALLRHVAHASTGACPEGIVYFRAAGTSLDDLLQTLFHFLFECDVPTKRTPGQLASDLARWEVLFVLDDVGLDEDELETLLDTAPMSVFVLSSAERTLWSAGEGAELRGLPLDAAQALFEARLRRALSEPERAAFAERWAAADGLPQQLVKDAERARAAARGAAPPELCAEDRELLKLTAALDGVPLGTAALAELTDRPDAAAHLERLEEAGLTQSHSPRFSATAQRASLLDDAELVDVRHHLLAYFTDRAERRATDPARPRDDLDPIVALLRWGRTGAPHADVVRLARASDTIAAGAGMWDAWRTILDIGLESARAIGDRDGESWALHQLGTRALCLEEKLDASRLLNEALRLRRLAGDRAGAANTSHNMRFLPGAPGSPDGSQGGPPFHPGSGGGGAGGAGPSLLAPASWPLQWLLVLLLLAVVCLAGAHHLAGPQDVTMRSAFVRDRSASSVTCANELACRIACHGRSACPDLARPRGHDDRQPAGGDAHRDDPLDGYWRGVLAGHEDPPPHRAADRGSDEALPADDHSPGHLQKLGPAQPGGRPDSGQTSGAGPTSGSSAGSDPGLGSDPGSGSDPGLGSDPGSSSDPGSDSDAGSDPGSDSDAGSDPDSGADPGSDATTGSSSGSGDGQGLVSPSPERALPTCDALAALATFIRSELAFPAEVLADPVLSRIVDEQVQMLRDLIVGLNCDAQGAAIALLDRLVAALP